MAADNYLSEILILAFNFPPKGYAFCNGQTMPINQNQALFSLLGTTYGGNGVSTFQLPNLQGQTFVHFGVTPGSGTSITLGQAGGELAVTLTSQHMPSHNHAVMVQPLAANAQGPAGAYLANQRGMAYEQGTVPNPALTTALATAAVGISGQGQPHENRPPYAVVNLSIALQGIFPSRS
jgi:microcystin-dependent protein